MNKSIGMHLSMWKRFIFVLLIGSLASCSSQVEVVTVEPTRQLPTLTATATARMVSRTPTPTTTSRPTHPPTTTATPTVTTTPSTTPFPTVTPPPTIDTKTVFLQYGVIGGDGGHDTDLYYGREMPSLVIYTDGQVILREGNWEDFSFWETYISTDEMCSLLAQLQSFGFFEHYDPIYAFDETTEFSDGGPEGVIHVNGPHAESLFFYGPYREYLISPLKQANEFISNYRPSATTRYMPERVVLWIEVAPDALPENAVVELWPDALPSITDLWQDPINGELLVEGELVTLLMELFDYRMTGKWIEDEGETFWIILRPLLPNETPYPQLWYYHDYARQYFNLPFACPDLELPQISPSRTPSPVSTIEPVSELTGKGRILFTSKHDGNADVYVMNADGSNVLNLTNHLAKDDMAAWSPDGQRIAFVSNRDGNDEIYLMNGDGTNVVHLTHSPTRDWAPAWSPGGNQLVFMSDRLGDWRDPNWQLFVIDVETGAESRFTDTMVAGGMYGPDWSPDGEKILFSSGNWDALQIFVIDKDGENKTLLGAGTGAVWSPNGQQIAFLKIGSHGNHQIYVMNIDQTDMRQITLYELYIGNLAWSPDGNYLVYSSSAGGTSGQEIYVVPLGSETRRLQLTVNTVDDYSSSWSK